MRLLTLASALAVLTVAGPVFAQDRADMGYSAYNSAAAYGQTPMGAHPMMHNARRHHALGSMRHPTVGNTANQRINGG